MKRVNSKKESIKKERQQIMQRMQASSEDLQN